MPLFRYTPAPPGWLGLDAFAGLIQERRLALIVRRISCLADGARILFNLPRAAEQASSGEAPSRLDEWRATMLDVGRGAGGGH